MQMIHKPGFSKKMPPGSYPSTSSSALVYDGSRYGESTGLFDTRKGHTYDGVPGLQSPSSHSIAALPPDNFKREG